MNSVVAQAGLSPGCQVAKPRCNHLPQHRTENRFKPRHRTPAAVYLPVVRAKVAITRGSSGQAPIEETVTIGVMRGVVGSKTTGGCPGRGGGVQVGVLKREWVLCVCVWCVGHVIFM